MAQEKMLVVADTPADQDAIGYKEHISGLIEMIKSVESTGSFTIGVYGEWGQGKTSALRQIQKDLNDNERETVLTVWFNPWRFTGEKHLIIPFFHTLVAELKERADKLEKSWPDEIKKKVWSFLKKLAHVPVALAYGLEFEVNAKVISVKYDVAKTIDKQHKAEDEINQQEQVKQAPSYKAAMQKYESMYYTLGETLKTAAEELNMKDVVFIDDLDRCLPEQGIELLEGLKVLMDLPGFVFVIGVAREVIERGIRIRYKELYLIDGKNLPIIERDYLDKIVQFTMTLPPVDYNKLKAHLAGC